MLATGVARRKTAMSGSRGRLDRVMGGGIREPTGAGHARPLGCGEEAGRFEQKVMGSDAS